MPETAVANGECVVPHGVAVEVLDGGKEKLSDECPAPLKELLDAKGLVVTYDKMVAAIVDQCKTRSKFGEWHDKEFDSIIDLFRDEFATGDISVALCKKITDDGEVHRWLEFIDKDIIPDYVPAHGVGNYSGKTISTIFSTIEFPDGVAVEEFSQCGNARKKLKEKIPVAVEDLLSKKGLMVEYNDLIEAFVDSKKGGQIALQNWDVEALREVMRGFRPRFEAKGVALFVSVKREYVPHGQTGGYEHFRWLEFVDMEVQPDYKPKRESDGVKEECSIL